MAMIAEKKVSEKSRPTPFMKAFLHLLLCCHILSLATRASNIIVWTHEHNICSLDGSVYPTSLGVHSLNSSLVLCREAPYMTYVRQNLAKLSTTDISKLSGMNEYKHQVLQAISDLYSDLEARRKPMIIELNAGKALDIMLSPTTLLIPKEGEKLLLLHPISFAIPEENIISINPPKNKTFGAVIPGKTSTYFTSRDEATYFADMEKSLYVLTFKKGTLSTLLKVVHLSYEPY